jgi:hypothetical protein
VGFIAAKAAVEWADQNAELRRTEVVEDLVRFFGNEARDYVEYFEKNWNDEPFSGGCPSLSVSASGTMEDYSRATREPFINCHFCGTESATQWQGYMDGAIESGERVANEVLYAMYGKNATIQIDYEKTFYAQREEINRMKKAEKEKHSSSWSTWIKLSSLASAAILLAFSLKKSSFNLRNLINS